MANQEHLDMLKQGVEAWNQWRQKHPKVRPDLSGAKLSEANLSHADLKGVDLSRADLSEANLSHADLDVYAGYDSRGRVHIWDADLRRADLSGAKLSYAHLSGAYLDGTKLIGADLSYANLSRAKLTYARLSGAKLTYANLIGANLSWADLSRANLWGASLDKDTIGRATLTGTILRKVDLSGIDFSGKDLSRVDLSGANLSKANLTDTILQEANLNNANLNGALLIRTNLEHTNLDGCSIYGISVWNVRIEGSTQASLIISGENEPITTVDDLEIAQFIYLLLNHKKLRNAISAVAERGVLLLGRFGGGGIELLQAIAAELRTKGYLPMIFDFERPRDRDYTETVKILAGLSRFIIADLSGPSVPQELSHTVPFFDIALVPIIDTRQRAYSMFVDFYKYPWVGSLPLLNFLLQRNSSNEWTWKSFDLLRRYMRQDRDNLIAFSIVNRHFPSA